MRQILDGKWYDTEKAELIYEGSDPYQQFIRRYYRTAKGTFFCHYVNVGKLELVSAEAMMQILAIHDVDKYIELFGEVEEG